MLKDYPPLHLPPIKLRVKRTVNLASLPKVWDPLRRVYIVLTREEWVRQHVIQLLISRYNIPQLQIIAEYPVLLNGQPQRADLVIVDSLQRVRLLVECKAPEVKISQSTLDQAVRYNSQLKAQYIMLTNGLSHHLYKYEDGEYITLSQLPADFISKYPLHNVSEVR
ncbi:MAG: type I restriction enzyme HsdR N-terminal domain-containing protein [Rikenellaceae bacterium]